MASKQVAEVDRRCVACGCCVKVCPRRAIAVDRGVTARVDRGLCVGCGRCAAVCPAGAVALRSREGAPA